MRLPRPQSALNGPISRHAGGDQGITDAVPRCQSGQDRDRMKETLRDDLVRLLPRLRRFAYSLTRDPDQCSDLVQEACARALAKLDQWQEGTRFDSWMFRIIQNIWFDKIRAEKTRGPSVHIDDVPNLIDSDARVVVESRLTLFEVLKGIEKLPTDQQVVVALVCVDGMSYKEAAEVLDIPIGTVMSRLSRARLTLSAAIYGDNKVGH